MLILNFYSICSNCYDLVIKFNQDTKLIGA